MFKKRLKWGLTLQKLLLMGGMIGLVFSKAEGVSLLPFPYAIQLAAVSSYLGLHNTRASYTLTVKSERTTKSKTGKVKYPEPVSDAAAIQRGAEALFVPASESTQIFLQGVCLSRRIADPTVPRGPPAPIV